MSAQLPLTGARPTHGHGDHHGGGAHLQQTFGIPIYLGSGDATNKPFVVTGQLSHADAIRMAEIA